MNNTNPQITNPQITNPQITKYDIALLEHFKNPKTINDLKYYIAEKAYNNRCIVAIGKSIEGYLTLISMTSDEKLKLQYQEFINYLQENHNFHSTQYIER